MILLNCIFEGSNLQKWEKGKKTSTVMSLKITGDITKKARFYRTFLWLYLFCTTIMVGEGGFEPPKPKQQIYSLPHLTALELSHIRFSLRLEKNWSWWTDSNPRPADYKSAALPAELHQHLPDAHI